MHRSERRAPAARSHIRPQRTTACFALLLILLTGFAACSSDSPPDKMDPAQEKELKSCAKEIVNDCNELLEQPEDHAACLRAGLRKCIDVE